jgi:bacterioferritin (cytochrome b1)
MEASNLKQRPPFRVITFRDDQEVISEDVETEVAARTRFASAIDLCKTRDSAHAHRVVLQSGGETIAAWPQSVAS